MTHAAMCFLTPVALGSALVLTPVSVVQDDPGSAARVVDTARVATDPVADALPHADPREVEAMRQYEATLRALTAGDEVAQRQTAYLTAVLDALQNDVAIQETKVVAAATDLTSLRAQLSQLQHDLEASPDEDPAAMRARVAQLRARISEIETVLADREAQLVDSQNSYVRAKNQLRQQQAELDVIRAQEFQARQLVRDALAAQARTAPQPQPGNVQASDALPADVARPVPGRTTDNPYTTAQAARDDVDALMHRRRALESAIATLREAGVSEPVRDLERRRAAMEDELVRVDAARARARAGAQSARTDADLVEVVMTLRDEVRALRDEVRGLRHAIEGDAQRPRVDTTDRADRPARTDRAGRRGGRDGGR